VGRLEWVRLDCDIDDLPEAIAAGYHGSSVWYALARISGQFGLEGVIPGKFANANYLARRLGAPVEAMAEGLSAVVHAGIGQWDDGYLVIDMERFTNPAVRMMRERRARDRANRPSDAESLVNGNEPLVTVHNSNEPLVTVHNRNTTRRDETRHNSNRTSQIDPTLGGDKPDPAADEPPQAATPATTPKPKKPDPLKHITLNESTWAFDGITNEDRAAWAKDAPHVNLDRELSAMLAYAQTHPGKLAAWRKGGRWVSTIAAWMIRAQQFAEKRPGGTATVPRKQDDPTRDRYGREYSSVRMARELGITVGGA